MAFQPLRYTKLKQTVSGEESYLGFIDYKDVGPTVVSVLHGPVTRSESEPLYWHRVTGFRTRVQVQ